MAAIAVAAKRANDERKRKMENSGCNCSCFTNSSLTEWETYLNANPLLGCLHIILSFLCVCVLLWLCLWACYKLYSWCLRKRRGYYSAVKGHIQGGKWRSPTRPAVSDHLPKIRPDNGPVTDNASTTMIKESSAAPPRKNVSNGRTYSSSPLPLCLTYMPSANASHVKTDDAGPSEGPSTEEKFAQFIMTMLENLHPSQKKRILRRIIAQVDLEMRSHAVRGFRPPGTGTGQLLAKKINTFLWSHS